MAAPARRKRLFRDAAQALHELARRTLDGQFRTLRMGIGQPVDGGKFALLLGSGQKGRLLPSGRPHGKRRGVLLKEGGGDEVRKAPDLVGRLFLRPLLKDEIQPFLGARHGDVQEVELALALLLRRLLRDERAVERSDAGARLAVQPLGGKGEVVRIEQLVLRLHGTKTVVHVHKDDDGILQPLRGVHGEHLDGVFAAALAELHLVFPRLEGEQEGVHRARSRLGKVQHAAKAQLSLLLGEDLRLQTVREQQADHLARGAHPSEKAVAGGKLEECLQAQSKFVTQLFRIRAAGGAEGGRQRKAAAHGGKVPLRKAAQKGEHRPRHRDVLLGIVEIGQPAEDELGLPEVAHVDLCRGGDGDAHFA